MITVTRERDGYFFRASVGLDHLAIGSGETPGEAVDELRDFVKGDQDLAKTERPEGCACELCAVNIDEEIAAWVSKGRPSLDGRKY
jgi:hypothetical protein